MTEVMVIQGRELHAEDIGLIRSLLAEHGDWCRTRISEELCRRWDWRNGQGRFKDMEEKVVYISKDGRTNKSFSALEWLANLCFHIPNIGLADGAVLKIM